MEKKNIETFIKKYSLGGLLDKVRWVVKDKTLRATSMTSDRKLVTDVLMEVFDKEDSEIGIMSSDRLKQMVGAVGDDISLEIIPNETDATRISQLVISDANTEVTYQAGDLDTFEPSTKVKSIPTFEVEIPLTEEFIGRFLKAKSAMSESDLFTLAMNKKKKTLEMVIGYSKNNTNKIAISVPATIGKDSVKEPISFSAKNLKEILSVNSEAVDPILKVSEAGMAYIEFNKNGFQSQYYMIKIEIED